MSAPLSSCAADRAAASQTPPSVPASRSPASFSAPVRPAAAAQRSSAVTSLTRLPITPPRTLSSSAASVAPSTRSRPRGASAPDSGASTPNATEPPGSDGAAGLDPPPPAAATSAAAASIRPALTLLLRIRRRQRERQRLGVGARTQRVGGADVLLERQRHVVVARRTGVRQHRRRRRAPPDVGERGRARAGRARALDLEQ